MHFNTVRRYVLIAINTFLTEVERISSCFNEHVDISKRRSGGDISGFLPNLDNSVC